MFFSVAIGANEDALLDFFSNPFPAAGQTVLRNTEVFATIDMMEIKCLTAPIIATSGTFTAFIFDCLHSHQFTTLRYSSLQIFSAVSVFSGFWHT